jgi:tetratricopeptide (TPR) repeat protein
MAMLDAILGVSSTTFDLKGRIIRHTANVPLFVEEVCRGLKETGVLKGEWGNLSLDKPAGELGIPNSVQGVIAARLDRLPRDERALMQIAAALGPRAMVTTLREVAVVPEDKLQRALNTLDRSELLVRADAGGLQDTFEFPHEMIRQVTYDQMVIRTREAIHTRILAALEADESKREEQDILCYHAKRAKDWSKTLAYGRSVARKGVARSAFADAASHFEIAMDALDRTSASREREADAVDLRIEARMAYMGSGRVADWFDLGKEAERRSDAIDDLGRKVAAMTVRSAAQNFYSTPLEAIATGEQVVELAEKWGDAGWRSLAQYGLGQAYHIAGRYREAEQMTARACEQLMRPDARAPIGTTPPYLLLVCCMMKSVTHATLGELDIAEHFQGIAQEIADQTNRPFDRVAAGYSAGHLMLSQGNPAGAAIILDEAFALTQEHGVRIFGSVIACYRGLAYLEQGRLEEAKTILSDALEDARSVGYKSIELRAAIYIALTLCRLGQVRPALELLRDARNTARQQGFGGVEAEALFAEAAVTPINNEDDTAAAIRSLRNCIEIATQSEATPLRLKAEGLLVALQAHQETGERLR